VEIEIGVLIVSPLGVFGLFGAHAHFLEDDLDAFLLVPLK